MNKLYFRSESQARTFIEEVNGLGYEWHPVHLCEGIAAFIPNYNWVLEFEADKRNAGKIRAYYFGS